MSERRFLIRETVEYLVTANTPEQAEDLFLAHGPSIDPASDVVQMGDVVERMVEDADAPF